MPTDQIEVQCECGEPNYFDAKDAGRKGECVWCARKIVIPPEPPPVPITRPVPQQPSEPHELDYMPKKTSPLEGVSNSLEKFVIRFGEERPKTRPCPTCSYDVSKKAFTCPKCGHHFRNPMRFSLTDPVHVVGALIALFLLFLWFAHLSAG